MWRNLVNSRVVAPSKEKPFCLASIWSSFLVLNADFLSLLFKNSPWSGIMTTDDTELQEINIFNDEQRRISQEHTLAEHYHDHPKSQEERKKFSVEKSSVLPYYEKKKFSILSKLL